MENLLFESKGVAKKYILVNTICSIFLIIFGILMLFVRNMRRDTVDISKYANDNIVSVVGTDRIGGGYILTDGARSTLMILGVVLIVLGIIFFFNMFSSNKSYVKISRIEL